MRFLMMMLVAMVLAAPLAFADDTATTRRTTAAAEAASLDVDAARATVAALREAEAKDRQDALADFKKGAGLGISIVMGSDDDAIDEAVVVNNRVTVTRRSADNVRAALEIHQFLTPGMFRQGGLKQEIEDCGSDPTSCPLFGFGPFAAIQVADDNAISSAGLGVMFGLRSDPRKETSFNVGVGVVWDNRVKTLAAGFVEGQPLPSGETAIRFEERSTRRLMLTLSFAF